MRRVPAASGRTPIVAVTLAAAAFLACDNAPVEPGEPDGDPQLTLSPDTVVVSVFQSSPLVATVRDAGGAVQYVALHYVSRDQGVATVNAGGAISAVAVGSTWVVAAIPDRPDVRDSVRVRVYADSCSGVRPDFGGPASDADRALFASDATAPLNLEKTFQYTANGGEVSSVTFSGADGGQATGMMWEPVGRLGLRPGMIVMHGLPGSASGMSLPSQLYAEYGAVVIAIDAPWNHRGAPPYLTFTDQDRIEQIQVVRDQIGRAHV